MGKASRPEVLYSEFAKVKSLGFSSARVKGDPGSMVMVQRCFDSENTLDEIVATDFVLPAGNMFVDYDNLQLDKASLQYASAIASIESEFMVQVEMILPRDERRGELFSFRIKETLAGIGLTPDRIDVIARFGEADLEVPRMGVRFYFPGETMVAGQ